MLNINKLKNISKDKKCLQSSLSKWSEDNDANRLVDTTLDVDFAMHTDEENNPWWMVDLGKKSKIEKIIIWNRKTKNFHYKARTLKVEVSLDSQRWKVVQQGFQYWDDRKDILLKHKIEARYVKISLEENTCLHLSNMGVYTRNYFIISGRSDGLGGRLQNMLNTMYIAKNSNLRFAYTWTVGVNDYAKDFMQNQKIGKNEIVGHAIEAEEELFDNDFIKKYSCTGQVMPKQGNLRSKRLKKIEDIKKVKLEGEWGWYGPKGDLTTIFSEIDKDDYYHSLPKLWTEIGFKENIKSLIKDAKNLSSKFSSNFIAIHIRSGDIVYGGYRLIGKRFTKKALPLHLGLGAIEKALEDGYNIVLFGDDSSSNNQLIEFYKGKIKTIEDFFPNRELSNSERAIFEISFMSHAKTIMASGTSYFSFLATNIGNIGGVTSLYKSFTAKEQYDIYKKYINNYEFNSYQMAFSYFHLYMIASELKKTLDELEEYIKKGMEYDSLNNKYLIFTIDILLKQNKIDEVENMILERLKLENSIKDDNYKTLAKTLVVKADKKYWYSSVFEIIKNNNSSTCLAYLSSVIEDELNNTSISVSKLKAILND